MPSRKGLKPHPYCYLASGNWRDWPHGALVAEPPQEALIAQEISQAFRRAYLARNYTIREAAKKAGISEKTVFNLLHGKTWGDMPTIARIERNFKIRLWTSQINALSPP